MDDVAIFKESLQGSGVSARHWLLQSVVREQFYLVHREREALSHLSFEVVKGLIGAHFDAGAARFREDSQDYFV